MRTTIDLPDALFRELKAHTGRQGISLKEFVTDALQEKLTVELQPAGVRARVKLPIIPKGRFPGLQSVTNAEVERLLWDEKLPG
jgi:hypothetical protein